jgi:alkylation response protein AidB-like acyl-CoA dehydrogenase
MPSYSAPVDDMRFLLRDVLDVRSASNWQDVDDELIDAILDSGAKFFEEIWQPLNQSGDAEGCIYENGVVRTPTGFKEALQGYYGNGWNTLSYPEAIGGQGLPQALAMLVQEMGISSNMALSIYPGLSMGVCGVINSMGTPEMKQTYVPKLMAGEWTGTMNLTEPHCGTDLKLLRTKAILQDDGSYKITGTKIFISGGEHDMADNIVHMVLAKIPEEGDGLGAVNVFIVPKYAVNDDGSLGSANGVTCGSIENKMGIRGSSTAVLNYDEAVGYRLGGAPKPKSDDGEKKKSSAAGMAGMFQMMNGARLGVGYQGVGISEVAYQNAVEYSKERLAGRALTGAKYPDQAADPIIVHPDVRRMLLRIRAFTEGARALAIWLSFIDGKASKSGDEAEKETADDLMDLLTPVIKAYFTDMGFENTNMAMQCFGGHGYVKDHGMEQFVRDSRILQLYEGANGVQALDLVGRKLAANGGRAPQKFYQMLGAELAALSDNEALADIAKGLKGGMDDLMAVTMWLAQNAPQNRDEAGSASSEYLRMFGLVSLGFMWAKMAQAAQAQLNAGEGDKEFLEMKLSTARFFMARMMPETTSLKAMATSGAEHLMTPAESAF